MKLAISQIAWSVQEEPAIARHMVPLGFEGVEVTPARLWHDPVDMPPSAIRGYRRFWDEAGISIVAMQSLLFGRPDLLVFADAETRARTLNYLSGLVLLASRLGVPALVFGSPRNRRKEKLSPEAANEIAVPFFRYLGDLAATLGTCLCLEPNPPQYGCDFITTSDEALDLVLAVDSPGFRLHLDSAAMLMAGEEVAGAIARTGPWVRHFHVSAPALAHVGPEVPIDYRQLLATLRRSGYEHWASVEMRAAETENVEAVIATMSFLRART